MWKGVLLHFCAFWESIILIYNRQWWSQTANLFALLGKNSIRLYQRSAKYGLRTACGSLVSRWRLLTVHIFHITFTHFCSKVKQSGSSRESLRTFLKNLALLVAEFADCWVIPLFSTETSLIMHSQPDRIYAQYRVYMVIESRNPRSGWKAKRASRYQVSIRPKDVLSIGIHCGSIYQRENNSVVLHFIKSHI